MKEIMAIIRMDRMNATKRALSEAGIPSFTARKVMGRGRGKVDFAVLMGAQKGYDEAIAQLGPAPRLIPKRMITLFAPDDQVSTIVETIIRVNKTGSPGDGKIFIMPALEAYRVRTGESGDQVLDKKTA